MKIKLLIILVFFTISLAASSAVNSSVEISIFDKLIDGTRKTKKAFKCDSRLKEDYIIMVGGNEVTLTCNSIGMWIKGQQDIWVATESFSGDSTTSIISKFKMKSNKLLLDVYTRNYHDNSWVCFVDGQKSKKMKDYCRDYKVECESIFVRYEMVNSGHFKEILRGQSPPKGVFQLKHNKKFFTYCGKSAEYMHNLGKE